MIEPNSFEDARKDKF
jgi:hypothetical protein